MYSTSFPIHMPFYIKSLYKLYEITENNNQRLHCAFSFTFRSMWKPFYSSGMANKLQKILGTPNYKPREIMDYQKNHYFSHGSN